MAVRDPLLTINIWITWPAASDRQHRIAATRTSSLRNRNIAKIVQTSPWPHEIATCPNRLRLARLRPSGMEHHYSSVLVGFSSKQLDRIYLVTLDRQLETYLTKSALSQRRQWPTICLSSLISQLNRHGKDQTGNRSLLSGVEDGVTGRFQRVTCGKHTASSQWRGTTETDANGTIESDRQLNDVDHVKCMR